MADDLTVAIRARDAATGTITLTGTIKAFGATTVGTFTKVTGAVAGFTRALTGGLGPLSSYRTLAASLGGVGIVKVFADFELAMAQVNTVLQDTDATMEELEKGVLKVSQTTGESLDNLTRGLREIISSGVNSAEAIKLLGQASKLAAAGVATTDQAVAGLLSVLKSYNLEMDEAQAVSDSIFQTMLIGRLTVGELSDTLGRVAPFARQVGLSFDEMNASIAALTLSGLDANEAVTALRALMSNIVSPTERAREVARALNIEFSSAAIQTRGWLPWLQDLGEKTGRNSETMAAMLENVRALVGAFSLTADQGQNLVTTLAGMDAKAGSVEQAFAKVARTLSFQLSITKNKFLELFIDVGGAAKPWLVDMLAGIRRIVDKLIEIRPQIGLFLTTIVATFDSMRRAAVQAWAQNELGVAIGATFRFILRTTADFLVQLVPLMLHGAVQAGRAFVGGLIDTITTEGKVGLAKIAAVLGTLFIEPIVGEDEAFRLKRLGDELLRLETVLEGFKDASVPLLGTNIVRDTENEILAVKKLIGRGGSLDIVLRDATRIMAEKGAEAGAGFNREVIDNIARLKNELPPEIRPAVDEIVRIWGELPEKLKQMQKTQDFLKFLEGLDVILGLFFDTGQKAGKSFKMGVKQILDIDPRVADILAPNDQDQKAMESRYRQMLDDLRVLRVGEEDRTAEELKVRFQKEVDDFREAQEKLKRPIEEFHEWYRLRSQQLGIDLQRIYQRTLLKIGDILGDNITDVAVHITQNTEDIGQAFKDMVTTILAEIQRLFVRRFVQLLLGQVGFPSAPGGSLGIGFGAAMGGVIPGHFNALPHFAGGSPRIDRATLGVVGEGMHPEAIVPLPDGRSIPVQMKGGEKRGDVAVNLTFNVSAMDGKDATRVILGQESVIKAMVIRAVQTDDAFTKGLRGRVVRSRT